MRSIFNPGCPVQQPADWRIIIHSSQSLPIPILRTATDAFLLDSLGSQYRMIAHYSDDEMKERQRKADLDNLILFAARHSNIPEWDKILNELQTAKQSSSPNDFVQTLLTCMENEREFPNDFFAYHAFSAGTFFVAQILEIITELRSDKKNNFVLARGGHKLFGGSANIAELLAVWGHAPDTMKSINNYDEKIPTHLTYTHLDGSPFKITSRPISFSHVLLSANPFLVGSPNVRGSCTVVMFHNNQTKDIDWEENLAISLEEAGISLSDDTRSLLKNHFWEAFNLYFKNNFLWQIRMTRELAEQITYLSHSLGTGIRHTLDLCHIKFLERFRNDGTKENLPIDLNTLQMRIGLIPDKVESKFYNVTRFAANPALLKNWLENSEFGYPALKTCLANDLFENNHNRSMPASQLNLRNPTNRMFTIEKLQEDLVDWPLERCKQIYQDIERDILQFNDDKDFALALLHSKIQSLESEKKTHVTISILRYFFKEYTLPQETNAWNTQDWINFRASISEPSTFMPQLSVGEKEELEQSKHLLNHIIENALQALKDSQVNQPTVVANPAALTTTSVFSGQNNVVVFFRHVNHENIISVLRYFFEKNDFPEESKTWNKEEWIKLKNCALNNAETIGQLIITDHSKRKEAIMRLNQIIDNASHSDAAVTFKAS